MEDTLGTSLDSVRTLYQGSSKTAVLEHTSQAPQESQPSAGIHGSDDITGINSEFDSTQQPAAGPSTSSVLTTTAPPSPQIHALVLPSAPDSPGPGSLPESPSIDSVSESSFPSVSSSFFFSSSAPGSPGRSHPESYPSSHPHSDHEHEHESDSGYHLHHARANEQGLIIPSLTLPEALRRPTPYGQTLGNIKVLVLGGQGAGKSFLTGLLLEDNEDVVDVGTWEDWYGSKEGPYAHGKVLRASTDWAEQCDAFGLERYEATKNVEIIELPGYSHDADVNELITRLKSIIETPFHDLHELLHPEAQPSANVASMLATPSSPLYTALVFLLPSPPTSLDKEIIYSLSPYIPLIVLPRLHGPQRTLGSSSSVKLSDFRPASAVALRSGVFHSPETVALLRGESVDRFLRWREVERAVEGIQEGRQRFYTGKRYFSDDRSRRKLGEKEWGRQQGEYISYEMKEGQTQEKWSKAKWEAEWMESHSQDVATRLRQGTITEKSFGRRQPIPASFKADDNDTDDSELYPTAAQPDPQRTPEAVPPYDGRPYAHPPFDPLHFPSLLFFSASLLGPLKTKVGESVKGAVDSLREVRVQVALFGGFCVGLGLGFFAKGW
ncbi:hypothetical protein CPB84DRAFT_1780078 [Gymnopilus junonius]|uniref:Septin-type G domain-containing protein n=1 Tax=Gymnopilus junonius TaxID=109634 RepID=A0A9P5NM52_GYMJU|nr:hypothetical protein CPB84DRAFT_1780078 [Gymnopilus junonius]